MSMGRRPGIKYGQEYEHDGNRTHGSECERCRKAEAQSARANITVTHPEVAAEWYPTRTGDKTPEVQPRFQGRGPLAVPSFSLVSDAH